MVVTMKTSILCLRQLCSQEKAVVIFSVSMTYILPRIYDITTFKTEKDFAMRFRVYAATCLSEVTIAGN